MKIHSFSKLEGVVPTAAELGDAIYFYPPTANAFRGDKHYVETKFDLFTVRFYNPELTFRVMDRSADLGRFCTVPLLQDYCRKKGLHLFIAQIINPYDTDEVTGDTGYGNWPYADMTIVVTPRKRPVFFVNKSACGPGFRLGRRKQSELMIELSCDDEAESNEYFRQLGYYYDFIFDGKYYEISHNDSFDVYNDTFPQMSMSDNGIVERFPTDEKYWITLECNDFILRIISGLEQLLSRDQAYFKEVYGIEASSIPSAIFPA